MILAGDVGGTKTLLGLFTPETGRPSPVEVGEFVTLDELLEDRDIFENAEEGIFQTTPDGHFLSANAALAQILGFENPSDLIESRKNIGAELARLEFPFQIILLGHKYE